MAIDQNKVFSAEEAKALDRRAQMSLLSARKVKFKGSAKEAELVELIVGSNPEIKEEPKAESNGGAVKTKKPEGYVLKVDFTTNMKKGSILPVEKYEEMKARGISVDVLIVK